MNTEAWDYVITFKDGSTEKFLVKDGWDLVTENFIEIAKCLVFEQLDNAKLLVTRRYIMTDTVKTVQQFKSKTLLKEITRK